MNSNLTVYVLASPLFIRWARLMGEEDYWLKDSRFADDLRGDDGPGVRERMARWCTERTTQEAVDTLGKARDRPAGPVLSPRQALEHPHITPRLHETDVDYPGLPKPAPTARRGAAVGDASRDRVAPADARRAHRPRAGRYGLHAMPSRLRNNGII